MVKSIIGNGLDGFIHCDWGWTIMHEAIEYGHIEIVKHLIVSTYFSEYKALHIASECGNLETNVWKRVYHLSTWFQLMNF